MAGPLGVALDYSFIFYLTEAVQRVAGLEPWVELGRMNDSARNIEELRYSLSEWLTARGLDDSCCWWEHERQ